MTKAGPPPWIEKLSAAFRARFQFQALLGAGVSSCVYRALQPDLERTVVVKLLRLEFALEGQMAQRFRREAALLAGIEHPGVVRLLDHGFEEGVAYSVYPDERGESLDSWLRGRVPMEPEEARALLADVLEGLQAVHDAGVVHRDLKPANLLRTPEGRVKLLDFGLARKYVEDSQLTRTGRILGTPNYMSPAQITQSDAEPADDLYAVGVIGYELLFAENPFLGKDIGEVLQNHLSRHVDPPHVRDPEVPLGLSLVIHAMMAKERRDRPASAAAARARLQAEDRALTAGPTGGEGTLPDSGASTERHPRQEPSRQGPPPADSRGHPAGPRWAPPVALLALGLSLLLGLAPRPGPAPPPSPLPAAPRTVEYPQDLEDAIRRELDDLFEVRLGLDGRRLAPAEVAAAPGSQRLLSRDPLDIGRNLAHQGDLRRWFRWLEHGGRPEHLPPERREALARLDGAFQDLGLDPPFSAFRAARPATRAVLPDPATARWLAEAGLPAGPQGGWLGAAAEAFGRATQRQGELHARLERAVREKRWDLAPRGFEAYEAMVRLTRPEGDLRVPYPRLTSFYDHGAPQREAVREWLGAAARELRVVAYAAARSVMEEPETRERAALLFEYWLGQLRQESLGEFLHAPPWYLFGALSEEIPAAAALDAFRLVRAMEVVKDAPGAVEPTGAQVRAALERAARPPLETPAARLRFRHALLEGALTAVEEEDLPALGGWIAARSEVVRRLPVEEGTRCLENLVWATCRLRRRPGFDRPRLEPLLERLRGMARALGPEVGTRLSTSIERNLQAVEAEAG